MPDRFTLYDVFAVLIPGVVFIYLLAFTIERAVRVTLFDWTGGIGDATVLLIFGYAAGALLQAFGKAVIDPPWRWVRGGQPTATLLTLNSKILGESTKREALEALRKTYGELPADKNSKEYHQFLEDKTYRVWKTVAPGDPQAHRFLAEMHAMRAFVVAFSLLAIVTLAGGFFYGHQDISLRTHGTLTGVYVLLLAILLWRMESKAVTFARHVLTAYLKKSNDREGKDG